MPSPVNRSGESPYGMTLAQYAAARRKQPAAVKSEYGRLMRSDGGFALAGLRWQAAADGVVKFGLPVAGGALPLESESVIIPMRGYGGRRWYTLCVSSQVGCRMGCVFCRTGSMGLLHNLTASEIVSQWLAARELIRAAGAFAGPVDGLSGSLRNIVFMGMGEPLDNFDGVVQAIRVLNDPAGLGVPLSQITLSTVGRVDGLRRLATLGWANLRIAISLNAADDGLRSRLMPINKGMPLADLQRALTEYPLPRRGRFLIEYVLIEGVNDELRHADAVAAWCRPLRCTVNVIPYNPHPGAAFETPCEERVLAFLRRLRASGVFAKRRLTRGLELMGACGLLGNAGLQDWGEWRRPGAAVATVPTAGDGVVSANQDG